MPTTSSLLRSAEAARKKTIAYEDQVAAFEWENSAKTIDDYNKYSQYLSNRSQTYMQVDPSTSLSYQTKLRSASRAFRTEEIQRASIDIQTGRGSLLDKYEMTHQLFLMAEADGDFNSAQNLVQQLNSINIQLQNEQEKQQRLAEVAAKTRTTDITKVADRLINGDEVVQLDDGTKIAPLKLLNRQFADNGNVDSGNYFESARLTIEATARVLEDALATATDQETYDAVAQKLRDVQYKAFSTPAGDLTYDNIIKAEMMQRAGNPLYRPTPADFNSATQNQTYKMVKQKLDDIVWGRDQNGKYVPIEITSREGDRLDIRFDKSGKVVEQYKRNPDGSYATDKNGDFIINKDYDKYKDFTLENLLKKQGLDSYEQDGQLFAINPLAKLGDVDAGLPVRIAVGADGKVKFIREKDGNIGFFEINPMDGTVKEMSTPFDKSGFVTVGNQNISKNKPSLFGLELLSKAVPGLGLDVSKIASSTYSALDALQGSGDSLESLRSKGYVTPLAPSEVKNRVVQPSTPIVPLAQQQLTAAIAPQQNAALQAFAQSNIDANKAATAQELKSKGYVTPLAPAPAAPKPQSSVFNLASNALQSKKLPF